MVLYRRRWRIKGKQFLEWLPYRYVEQKSTITYSLENNR